MSVVVLVLACPARPATVTSGMPAIICRVMFVCRSECKETCGRLALVQILSSQFCMMPEFILSPFSFVNNLFDGTILSPKISANFFTRRIKLKERHFCSHQLVKRALLHKMSAVHKDDFIISAQQGLACLMQNRKKC